jgi:hypothetical protein
MISSSGIGGYWDGACDGLCRTDCGTDGDRAHQQRRDDRDKRASESRLTGHFEFSLFSANFSLRPMPDTIQKPCQSRKTAINRAYAKFKGRG